MARILTQTRRAVCDRAGGGSRGRKDQAAEGVRVEFSVAKNWTAKAQAVRGPAFQLERERAAARKKGMDASR